jgi:hypothetical protein
MYRIYGIAQTIEVERIVLNALASATLRREWCLFAGFRRPIGSDKRYSVELDCVVVNLLECRPVVLRPFSKIRIFWAVFLGDFGIAHIVKDDLLPLDAPMSIAIQPCVIAHRNRAPVVWLVSNVKIVTD